MKGADQVFPVRRINAGFTAHAGVDLGEQGGWNLDKGQAAQRGCGGKARQITNHAAAQRDDCRMAVDFLRQQFVNDICPGLQAFGGFAGSHDNGGMADTDFRQAVL